MAAQNDLPVPLLDLKAQFAAIKDEVMAAVTQVFEQQAFILGPHVDQAEKALAAHLGVPYALGVSSGTDALLLSLMALGVRPGDGVVTTPFTFFATVGSIVRLGAVPLLADIDPLTYNLDPARVEALLSRADLPAPPKAMIPVHLFGQSADMMPLMVLARAHNLKVVEDAAQAIGAVYPGPAGLASIGSIGHTGAFSFFPSKNLGGAGDGGLITSLDPELAQRLRSMRTHGSHPQEKYRHVLVGGNFRLDAVQAAVISVKLKYLEAWSQARRANAADYDRLLTASGLVDKGLVSLPHRAWPNEPRTHVFNQYVIRATDRGGLMRHLAAAKIGHAVYYPIPMHLLECFTHLGGQPGDLPQAEQAAAQVLAIPIYPELTPQQKERVVEVIADFYAQNK
ncbi:MAG: DegT/DnrJ/EryC1/StrS family aminotransferase [Desulfarculus sp.]|nr:DegT/DnrJ/EryC1/StrS family aminotransferase [Desulfarculus sp.]